MARRTPSKKSASKKAAKASGTELLASMPLFSSCSNKELSRIRKVTDEITVPDGKVLVDQGDIGREAFIIVDGTAVVRRNGRKVATLGPGDYFGEMALLDKGPRTASVTAEGELRLLVIGSREFSGVLDDVPPMARKLLRSLSQRVRDLDNRAYG